ncbi:MAG: phospho-sugar mutase [Oligoflexia bacterium]|nr:phospho-sugar mutase [Oligoflexia bacterium]
MKQKTVIEKARKWANEKYFDPESREEIQNLINKHDSGDMKAEGELFDRFYKDVEFGTGGLRCIIGMGSNRMSKYIVRRATQALADVVKKNFNLQLSVAISYDSRRFSYEFACETASVLAGNGITAYIYDKLTPTPMLSYAVRYLKSKAGVMVTASHNPPEYNGYKVYWDDGAQVIPPCDKEIITRYNDISNFNIIKFLPFEEGLKNGLIKYIGKEVVDSYHKAVYDLCFNKQMCKDHGRELKIVYTPIHGTGYVPGVRALETQGTSNILLVQEQINPDSNFSTVPSPNPENPKALKLAVDLMKREKADIAIGTDPDADRLGVVVNHKGEPYYLNGNQVAVLLLHYKLSNLKNDGKLSSDSVVIKSIVTSELQTALAKHYGVKIYSTLTGFKWMCGKLRELEGENPKLHFVFASEESYGYLSLADVRDKDAISAMSLMAEMALFYKVTAKRSLVDALDKIYEEHGLYLETLLSLDYIGIEGEKKIKRIMDLFRNYSKNQKDILGEKIVKIEDWELSEERDIQDGNVLRVSIIDMPKSNVLGFTTEKGNKIYLRPSGTEPKIKFYFMMRDCEKGVDLEHLKLRAQKRATEFEQFFRDLSEKA